MNGQNVNEVIEIITSYGLNVIGGIILLIVGWIGANWASAMTRHGLSKIPRVDETLRGFFSSLVRYVVLAFVVIAVLNQFGVQTTSIIAIFGAAGLAVGLALQGTLSNVAAGVMLLIFRPFKVGQYVEVGGHAGTVKHIGLFTTELATSDNIQVIIPNNPVWSGAVVNYSHHGTRRVNFVVGIGYGDSIDQAMTIIRTAIDADERILKDPAPQIVVGELADSSVNLLIRVWTASSDYWSVKCDLTKNLKEGLDEGGITIPFPQRDLHLIDHVSGKTAIG